MVVKQSLITNYFFGFFSLLVIGWAIYMFPVNPRFFGFLIGIFFLIIIAVLKREQIRVNGHSIIYETKHLLPVFSRKNEMRFSDIEKVFVQGNTENEGLILSRLAMSFLLKFEGIWVYAGTRFHDEVLIKMESGRIEEFGKGFEQNEINRLIEHLKGYVEVRDERPEQEKHVDGSAYQEDEKRGFFSKVADYFKSIR